MKPGKLKMPVVFGGWTLDQLGQIPSGVGHVGTRDPGSRKLGAAGCSLVVHRLVKEIGHLRFVLKTVGHLKTDVLQNLGFLWLVLS